MTRGWRYAKLFLDIVLLRVAHVCVCVMHPFNFMVSLRVSASYLPFLALPFLFLFYSFLRWSFVDVSLIVSCPADHVPDWQPRILQGQSEARWINV